MIISRTFIGTFNIWIFVYGMRMFDLQSVYY